MVSTSDYPGRKVKCLCGSSTWAVKRNTGQDFKGTEAQGANAIMICMVCENVSTLDGQLRDPEARLTQR